jgi:hypothetical protein
MEVSVISRESAFPAACEQTRRNLRSLWGTLRLALTIQEASKAESEAMKYARVLLRGRSSGAAAPGPRGSGKTFGA